MGFFFFLLSEHLDGIAAGPYCTPSSSAQDHAQHRDVAWLGLPSRRYRAGHGGCGLYQGQHIAQPSPSPALISPGAVCRC